ncbi:hypothetical protein A5689_23920 [Mycobacterium intracellulare subsp. yongonense]|nr:hypothetical protein A5689_23920 [Mycobacterium intracellulare subsp. yongonense]
MSVLSIGSGLERPTSSTVICDVGVFTASRLERRGRHHGALRVVNQLLRVGHHDGAFFVVVRAPAGHDHRALRIIMRCDQAGFFAAFSRQ